MSNIPQFNFPAFYAAAHRLRSLGYDIVSPAEMDAQHGVDKEALASIDGNATQLSQTWGDLLARDVKVVADMVQGVIFLPGWERSRGARLEAFTAILCGHEFLSIEADEPLPIRRTTEWVVERLL